jgi:hypothetical protein
MVKVIKKPLQVYLTDELKGFVENQAITQDIRMTAYIANLIKADKKRVERKANEHQTNSIKLSNTNESS